MKTITITVELSEAEAMAYAQFLKRVGWRDYRTNASSESEAYLMKDAGNKIQGALIEQGYAPR
jgi:hypothetical protein